ncbi:hypothetical protein [Pendulispora albinea]|uniref:Uncharacterized protein n=1 Tax=Pendulispora albinea TaxID=2741071 RepID=A0ABZ2LVC6_9BACT
MTQPTVPLPPKLRRALELVYALEGVASARIWQWGDRIALGVRAGRAAAPAELLRRVEDAVSALREPGEVWDFGLLDDDIVPEAKPDELT